MNSFVVSHSHVASLVGADEIPGDLVFVAQQENTGGAVADGVALDHVLIPNHPDARIVAQCPRAVGIQTDSVAKDEIGVRTNLDTDGVSRNEVHPCRGRSTNLYVCGWLFQQDGGVIRQGSA